MMPLSKIRLLALDVSLTSTGLSVIEVVDRMPKVIHMQEIRTKSSENYGKRLKQIETEITEVIEKFEPTHAVREAGLVRFNTATKAIYRAVGAVDISVRNMSDEDIPTVPIGTAKKSVTGDGRAPKEEVGMAVAKIYGLDFSELNTARGRFQDDIADSLAVGFAYLVREGHVDKR